MAQPTEGQQEYIQQKVNPLLENLVTQLLMERPENLAPFMIKWLTEHAKTPAAAALTEGVNELEELKAEHRKLQAEVQQLEAEVGELSDKKGDEDEEEEEDDDDDDEELAEAPPEAYMKKVRSSVSAEAYGVWNQRQAFVPPVHAKSEEQQTRIRGVLGKSFLFNSLEADAQKTIVDAMQEKAVDEGVRVITQGDDGDCLYVVEEGQMYCYKKQEDGTEKKVKECTVGDAFGELALLYNCPRAASVVAQAKGVLWQLDRETFNHVVRDAAVKRRERYEEFLKGVPLLKSMEAYERSQLCDALRVETCTQGTKVVTQGEAGDTFYILEEGECDVEKVYVDGTPPAKAGGERPSLGLAQSLKLKKFANHSASKERVIDEDQWRKNVVDIHRVMKMTQSMYLTLEQSNEAMLRLGVEIVTCKHSRKCIWWPDHWSDEDDKRDQFKKMVDEKLKVIIGHMRQRPPTPQDKGEVQNLQRIIAEVTKECKSAEDALETANQRVRDLEAELQALRMQDDDTVDEEAARRSAELLAAKAEIRALKAEIGLRCAEPPGETCDEAAETRPAACQTDSEWQHKDLQRPSATTLAAPARGAHSHEQSEEVGLRSELESFRRLSATRIEQLERQHQEDLLRIASLEQQLHQAERHNGEDAGQLAAPRGAEAAGLEALRRECEARPAAEAASAAELKALQDEIRQLEKDKFEMLETLSTLKANIGRLEAVGEAKGVDFALMQEILNEADVSKTVGSMRFNCFLRLYNDAMRRIEQRQKTERLLLGDMESQANLRLPRRPPVHAVIGPVGTPQLHPELVATPFLLRKGPGLGLGKDAVGGGFCSPPAREPPRPLWRQPSAGGLPGGSAAQVLRCSPGLGASISAPSLPLPALAPLRAGSQARAGVPQAPSAPPPCPARMRFIVG